MRHRMYDPRVGHFTQQDPVLFNRPTEGYGYARNNPLLFTDPWGLDVDPAWGPYATREAIKRGDWSKITIGDAFTANKFRDLQNLYQQWDQLTWLDDLLAAQRVSQIESGIASREADLNRILREGAYPVLHDEDIARRTLFVHGARSLVEFGSASLGAGGGKGCSSTPSTADAPSVSGMLPPPKPAGGTTVYRSVEDGITKYAGITDDLARRAAEHLRNKGIQIEEVLTGLSRSDARAVEQALIEIHGLGKKGGTLLNKINSIAPTNPIYAAAVRRGYELLGKAGYDGLPLVMD